MKVISYEDRVAKMEVPGDEDRQMRLAKAYVTRVRNEMKKAKTLKDKLNLNESLKKAEGVLKKLRLNVFDLEDMLNAKVSPESQATSQSPALPVRGM